MRRRGFRFPFAALAVLAGAVSVAGASLLARPVPAFADDAKGGKALDFASLGKMLDGLGYGPKKAGEAYDVVQELGGGSYDLRIEISGSRKKLWITAFLLEVKEPDRVPADRWRALAAKNFSIQPAQFYLTAWNGLHMGYAIDNRGVTAGILRNDIQFLAEQLHATRDVWEESAWVFPAETEPSGPDAQPPPGGPGHPGTPEPRRGPPGRTPAPPPPPPESPERP